MDPDTYFYVGKGLPIGKSNGKRVSHMKDGTFKPLDIFNGNSTVVVTPVDMKIEDVKWLAVMCQEFGLVFSSIKFRNREKPPKSKLGRLIVIIYIIFPFKI